MATDAGRGRLRLTGTPAHTGELAGRCALVTGVGDYIALETAAAFARAGAIVGVADPRPAAVETARTVLRPLGQCFGYVADIAEREKARDVVMRFLADAGTVDVLYNGADGPQQLRAPWLRPASFTAAVLNMTAAVLEPMVDHRSGAIINVTAIPSPLEWGAGIGSTGTDDGVIGLTQAIAGEYGTRGVTCNVIVHGLPGLDDHGLLAAAFACAAARTALLLASSAGALITGALLTIDAGLLTERRVTEDHLGDRPDRGRQRRPHDELSL